MERIWYYADGTERRGPHTESEMNDLLAQGAVTPATLVWSEGMGDWVRLSASSLAAADGSAPPLPAPRPAVAPAAKGAPDGLRGWMQFCGIMLIAGGVMQSLSCIGAIFGVPLIIAGVAFSGSASKLDSLASMDPGTSALLGQLRTGFKALGVGIIISLVLTLLVLGIYLILGLALFKSFVSASGI